MRWAEFIIIASLLLARGDRQIDRVCFIVFSYFGFMVGIIIERTAQRLCFQDTGKLCPHGESK